MLPYVMKWAAAEPKAGLSVEGQKAKLRPLLHRKITILGGIFTNPTLFMV